MMVQPARVAAARATLNVAPRAESKTQQRPQPASQLTTIVVPSAFRFIMASAASATLRGAAAVHPDERAGSRKPRQDAGGEGAGGGGGDLPPPGRGGGLCRSRR